MRLRTDKPTPPAPGIESLTPRERETLAWLTRGVSNKEIARELDLAESTVKVHVQSVLRKLNIRSRVQAAGYSGFFPLMSWSTIAATHESDQTFKVVSIISMTA